MDVQIRSLFLEGSWGPCVPRILKMCICFNPAILFLGNKDVAIGKLSVRLFITARGTASFCGS